MKAQIGKLKKESKFVELKGVEATEEEPKVKAARGVIEEHMEPTLVLPDDVIENYEKTSGIIVKIRKLFGIRKIGGLAKRQKDEKPRPNFDRALGLSALTGIIAGIVIYILLRLDIFLSLGMSVGLIISVSGALASIILLYLWKKNRIEFSKKISILITILMVFVGLYGIYINTVEIFRCVGYILVALEVIIAVFLVVRELIIFLIRRDLYIISMQLAEK